MSTLFKPRARFFRMNQRLSCRIDEQVRGGIFRRQGFRYRRQALGEWLSRAWVGLLGEGVGEESRGPLGRQALRHRRQAILE
jgi:hypothetical protein